MVVTTGAVIRAKLQSTNQHPTVLQAGCPSCRPTKALIIIKALIISKRILHKMQSVSGCVCLLVCLQAVHIQVIRTDTDQSDAYDFLLTLHSNHGPIL